MLLLCGIDIVIQECWLMGKLNYFYLNDLIFFLFKLALSGDKHVFKLIFVIYNYLMERIANHECEF